MEMLFRLSNEWPKSDDNVAFKFKADADGIIRNSKDIFLLHNDGKVYKSFSGLPFISHMEENQLFKLIAVNEEIFILQKVEKWPDGITADNGITSRFPTCRESFACWYMHSDGKTMPTYFDAPAIAMHRKVNEKMPVITCQVLV